MNWDLIRQYVQPKTMLDIGAHTGDYYRGFKAAFPDCACLLIDGNPDVESYLQQTGTNYYIMLLGKENKEVTFYKNQSNSICTGDSMYRELSEHYADAKKVTLKCHRLDDINKNNNTFDFVKIDTQGAELDILEGGKNTFARSTAIVLETSIVSYNEGAPLQHQVIEYMNNHNFIIKHVVSENKDPQGVVFQQDVLFVRKK